MPLTPEQIDLLGNAIREYNYPAVTFDFIDGREIAHDSMRSVEKTIRELLLSNEVATVKDGLSNVLFWGHYNAGFRDKRVRKFREQVDNQNLIKSANLFQNLQDVGLRAIKGLKLPEFSNVSFISKVRMFLDPANYVVLDRKLMKIARTQILTVFHQIKEHPTYLPVTEANQRHYQEWCNICVAASQAYFSDDNFIAVDVERGSFQLVDSGRIDLAATLVENIR
jgi:hypothetical protein